MWIGVSWAGLRVVMWITHVGDKFRHDLLEKSLNEAMFWELLSQSFVAEVYAYLLVVRQRDVSHYTDRTCGSKLSVMPTFFCASFFPFFFVPVHPTLPP